MARAKRTARGDLLVELVPEAWRQAKGLKHLELEGMGRWEARIWDEQARRPRTRLVVPGVPLDWIEAEFQSEFLACNGDRFPGVTPRQLAEGMGAPIRLKRRTSAGWAPSTAMKFDLPSEVAEAVMAVGFAVVALESRPLRLFQALPTVCARCQRPGHKAAFCRNPPRCRICPESTGDHDTRECPRARRDGGGAASPVGRRGRSRECSHRSPPRQNVGAQGASSQHE